MSEIIEEVKPAMQRWMGGEISAGKFCELMGLARHTGEDLILHPVWLLMERNRKIEKAIADLRELLPMESYMLEAYFYATFLPAIKEAQSDGVETRVGKICPTCGETCRPDDLKCDECRHDL
jgi:hypothetical protein